MTERGERESEQRAPPISYRLTSIHSESVRRAGRQCTQPTEQGPFSSNLRHGLPVIEPGGGGERRAFGGWGGPTPSENRGRTNKSTTEGACNHERLALFGRDVVRCGWVTLRDPVSRNDTPRRRRWWRPRRGSGGKDVRLGGAPRRPSPTHSAAIHAGSAGP